MARKENRAYFTENDTFATRLKESMAFRGLNQTHLEQKILNEQGYTMQRQTISQYLRGISKPDTERLSVLCKALDVSADYLLGFTEFKTSDKDLQFVCEYTGLSETVIDWLFAGKLSNSEKIKLVNDFLESKMTRKLLTQMWFYSSSISRAQNLANPTGDESYLYDAEYDYISQAVEVVDSAYHELRYAEFNMSETFSELLRKMFDSDKAKEGLEKRKKFLEDIESNMWRARFGETRLADYNPDSPFVIESEENDA